MKFQFFIFAWPGYFSAATKLETDLQARNCDVVVIASGAEDRRSNWIHLSDRAYFGEQFMECLRRFDGDVLVHIQADATIRDMDSFLKRLTHGYSHSDVGIWAPDVNYTFYQTRLVRCESIPQASTELDSSLIQVLNTDCTCWALARPVIEGLKSLDISDSHFGWGWDTIAASISRDLGLLVLRDTSIKLRHPRGTSYNAALAELEFQDLLSTMSPRLQETIAGNSREISKRYSRSRQAVLDKIRRRIIKLRFTR